MRFARWVFLLAGATGVLMIVPPFFLETKTGADYPPPINHPEYYYGFFGVTLAWQLLFLVIGFDAVRYGDAAGAGGERQFRHRHPNPVRPWPSPWGLARLRFHGCDLARLV